MKRALVFGVVLAVAAAVQAATVTPGATVNLRLDLGGVTTASIGDTIPFSVYASITGNTYSITAGGTYSVNMGLESLILDLTTSLGGQINVSDLGGDTPDVNLNVTDLGGTWGGLYQSPVYIGGSYVAGNGIQQFSVTESPVSGNQTGNPDANMLAKFKRGRMVSPGEILVASGNLTVLPTAVNGPVTLTAKPSTATSIVAFTAANPSPVSTNKIIVSQGAVALGNVTNGTGTIDIIVPEPASLALLGLGGLLVFARRRQA